MRTKSLLAVVLALGTWLPAAVALAQQEDIWPESQQQPQQEKTLMDRLNDFGHSIFGGQASDKQAGNSAQPGSAAQPGAGTSPSDGQAQPSTAAAPPRSGSVMPPESRIAGADLPDGPPPNTLPDGVSGRGDAPSGLSPVGEEWSRYTQGGAAAMSGSATTTGAPAAIDAPAGPAAANDAAAAAPSAAPAASDAAAPGDAEPSMYRRLQGSRESTFSAGSAAKPASAGDAASSPATPAPTTNTTNTTNTAEAVADPSAGAQTPTLAPPRPATSGRPVPLPDAAPAREPAPATEPAPTAEPAPANGSRLIDKQSEAVSQPAAAVQPSSPPAAQPASQPAAETDSNLLIARKSPLLSVQTKGPRRIAIGKEAAFEVVVENPGDVAAEEVVVLVGLPGSADVSGAEVTAGSARMAPRGSDGAELIQWSLSRLAAKGQEKLLLRLVPRQNQPFNLAVRWNCKAAASQATIEVQEPKLALRLDGPPEVFFGKRELFKLKLSNSGNGAAENVLLVLLPLGNGENRPVSHRMASLAAGEERALEVELTARQTGLLTIQVEVKADAGAHAELVQKVLVRRAALQVAAEGPAMQYVGTAATYRIHLRNPGNAPARNVRLSATLPAGAKYLAGSEGARAAAEGNQVQWTLPSLEPAARQDFLVRCSLGLPGAARLEVHCAADEELASATAVVTRVEAMAELRLEVKEPDGPVPLGEVASYEICVRNRGTKDAQDVEVLGYFSPGIEPVSAEGAPHRLGPGRVAFRPIPSLPAGEDVKFTVRARAEAAGNHVFRAEVHCKRLGTRLVSEQTTHFYQDQQQMLQASRDPSPGEGEPASGQPLRTADRRLPPGVAPQGEQPAQQPVQR